MAHLIHLSAINRHDLICQICQSPICQRVRSVRPWESKVRVQSIGLKRPAMRVRSLGQSHLSWPVSLISRPIGLLCLVESDQHLRLPWPHRSDSLTDHMTLWWEAVCSHGLPPRTPTASHLRLPRPPTWPHRFGLSRPIGLYQAKQCVRPWNQSDGPEDRIPSPSRVESDRTLVGGHAPWLAQTDHMTKSGRLCARESESGRPCARESESRRPWEAHFRTLWHTASRILSWKSNFRQQ